MAYDEWAMHEQNHPAWKDKPIGNSPETIGTGGCFISCLTYIRSRKLGIDFGIPEMVDILNRHNGFTADGLTKWDVVKNLMGLTISKTKPILGRVYTMRKVWVRGRNYQVFGHWVVELRGGLMYDPLRGGGKFVHAIDYYPYAGEKRYIT